MSIVKYAGRRLPAKPNLSGRSSASTRRPPPDFITTLQHSTHVDTVPRHVVLQSLREQAKRRIEMFNMSKVVNENAIPKAAGKGKPAKDWSADAGFQALKAMPVNVDAWYESDETFTDGKLAAKFQSKIAQYAKAGAGTFKTRLRSGKVYICKVNAEYVQQRNTGTED